MYLNSTLGQLAIVTNDLGNTNSFTYNIGDLLKVTNPLNNAVNFTPDVAGRTAQATDPLGNNSWTNFTALNQVVQSTDALNKSTGFTYDQESNLTQVQDAN